MSTATLNLSRFSLRTLWARYNTLLQTKPMLTRAVTSGVILGAADLACQKMEGAEKIDLQRVGSMAITGTLFVGPAVTKWYAFLGRLFGEKVTVRAVASKLALDQAFFLPLMFGVIMGSAGLLNGKSPEEVKAKLEAEYWTAVKNGWKTWSIATTANFALCPPHLRVLFNNTVSFGWNTYLSNVNNRELPSVSSIATVETTGMSEIIPQTQTLQQHAM